MPHPGNHSDEQVIAEGFEVVIVKETDCILTFADIKEPIWPASHRAILLARIHAKMLKHVNRYFVRIEWQGQLKISHLESHYRWVQNDSTTSLLSGKDRKSVV